MIQHIVLFGITKETSTEDLMQARNQLHALVGKIPGLVSLKADIDMGIEGNCRLGLVAHLTDRSALDVFPRIQITWQWQIIFLDFEQVSQSSITKFQIDCFSSKSGWLINSDCEDSEQKLKISRY